MVSLKKVVFSAERSALGRHVPIQKGAQFVMDNNWGAFERTIVARPLDGFPGSFNQLAAEYTSPFLPALSLTSLSHCRLHLEI